MEINIDTLINEVEKRPAIWDMSSHDYSNRTMKRRSWEELVLIFCGIEDSEEKKKSLGLELQKRWKGLRDGYVKEVKKMKQIKSGSGASARSSYLYYGRLQFLQPTIKKNSTESNFETAEVGDDEDVESATENLIEEDSPSASNKEGIFKTPNHQRKKIKLHPADEHFAKIIEKSLNQRNVAEKKEDDEDKLFCLSLVKEIKKVPETMRLKNKIEIYNLILKNQSVSTQSHPLNTTDTSHSNHSATAYSQQYTPRFAYSQYDDPNYTTTVPYGTPHQIYTQMNQNNIVPSPVSDISQESSDLYVLFG